MRWFIVLLLLANIVLFFWVQQQSRPVPGSTQLPPPDIGHLRLASETNEEPASAIEAAPQPAAEVELPEVLVPPSVMPEISPTTTHALVQSESFETPRTSGESESADRLEAEGLAAQQTAALSDVADAAPAPAEAEQTVAAGEGADDETANGMEQHAADNAVQTAVQVPEDLADSEANEPVSEVEPPAVEEPQAVCSRVGPFGSKDADQLIKGLPSSISLLSDVSEEHGRVVGYYVLIPALPSRAAAIRTMQKLADAGVSDTWLFRSGQLRNTISLGMFSREPGAQRRAKNVADKGFTTEVKERTWMRERRWLLLKSTDGGDLRFSLTLPETIEVEQQVCP